MIIFAAVLNGQVLTILAQLAANLLQFQLIDALYNYQYLGELHKLLDRIARCTDQVKHDKEFEPLQEIITFVQFANDECDYGMGLELGVDLFCHGDQFHSVVLNLLPLAYELLQRDQFGKIIGEHLKHRSKIPRDFCCC